MAANGRWDLIQGFKG